MSWETPLKTTIKGGFEHFAPSEKITVRVGKPPEGTRIERLALTITDRNDVPVYKAVWSQVPEKESPKIQSLEGGGPPRSIDWDGANNQLPALVDEEGQRVARWVTPLQTPFTFKAFAVVTWAAPLEEAPIDVREKEDARVVCKAERPASCSLESLCVSSGSKRSKSYRMLDNAVASDAEERFSYALGADEEGPLEILWEITGPEQITGGRLELYGARRKNAIWKRELTAEEVLKKKLVKEKDEPFIDEHILARRAPYELRMVIDGENPECRRAWTYIDVVVAGIELFWGEATMFTPAVLPVGDAAQPLAEEVALLRGLKGIAPEDAPRKLDVLLKDDAGAGRTRVDGKPHTLELTSNVYYQDIAEWHDGTPFNLHRDLWGNGPRIPIVADLKVKSSGGEPVSAPRALAGVELLWDWEDPRPDRADELATKEWLKWATERDGHEGDGHGPRSTNCPVSLGGKRGEGAAPVLHGDGGAEFHFDVRSAGKFRRWAAISKVYEGDDPRLLGKTGVVFQPSRMGGDAYRVRAYLFTGRSRDFHHDIQGEDLWQQAETAGLPRATTGTFEMWRRVDILRYIKKGDALPDIDVDVVNRSLAAVKIRVVMGKLDRKAAKKIWGAGLAGLLDEKKDEDGFKRALNVLAPLDQQVKNYHGLKLKSWAELANAAALAALDDLIAAVPAKRKHDVQRTRLQDLRAAIKDDPAAWRLLFDGVTLTEREALGPLLKKHFAPNPDWATSSADTQQNITGMAQHLGATQIRKVLNKNYFVPLMEEYVKGDDSLSGSKASLGGQAGLFVFHMGSVFPGQCDLSGGAVGLSRSASERGRGMFFFAYPPNSDDILVLDAESKMSKLVPMLVPFTLSRDFVRDYREDYDGLLVCVANASMKMVAEKLTPEAINLPPEDSTVDSLAAYSPKFNWDGNNVRLLVKSRDPALVRDAKRDLEACMEPRIVAGFHQRDERLVLLSRTANLGAHVGILKFGFNSKDFGKKGLREAMHAFVVDLFRMAHTPVTEVHILSADTERGRERRRRAHVHLDALLKVIRKKIGVNPDPSDHVLPPVYDLNALVTHELGHTLFLPHARPEEDRGDWRHVPGFSCLMNYDASMAEFCGCCALALRGWDIGSEGKPKLAGGPVWKGASPVGPPVQRAAFDDPEPDEDDGYHFIGYHGTSAANRSSLEGGLKVTGAMWDPKSGGELGRGFYVTTDYPTACLYGGALAELKGTRVDVWILEADRPLAEIEAEGLGVPTDEQYEKLPEGHNTDYDVLWNELEDPIAQYKLNERFYSHLRLRHFKELTINQAFREAESNAQPEARKKAREGDKLGGKKKIKAKGDGDCFFHSIAYHVKLDDLGRRPFLAGGRTFGDTVQELAMTTQVRGEIAEWMAQDIYGRHADDLDGNPPATGVDAHHYQAWWNHLTDNGVDTTHFGTSMLETVRNLRFDNQTAPLNGKSLIWGDIGFLWKAIQALYHRKVIVHYAYGGRPLEFGAGDPPITVHHGGYHYDIVVPGGEEGK